MSDNFTSVEQNKPLPSFGMKDLLDFLKRDIFLSMNCHCVATVQSFNSETQTVSASLNYKKTARVMNPQTRKAELQNINYPVLVDVPIIVMSGGAASLQFPIAVGDECLILFNDRDIDNWFKTGQNVQVSTPRAHSFSDGIALIGLRSIPRVITDWDNDRARLVNGDAYVGVSEEKIKIANATKTLLGVINGLIDILSTGFSANTPTPGNPLNPTAATQLTAYKSDVEELLE